MLVHTDSFFAIVAPPKATTFGVQLTSSSSSSSIALRATSSTRLGEGRSPGAFIVLAMEAVSWVLASVASRSQWHRSWSRY